MQIPPLYPPLFSIVGVIIVNNMNGQQIWKGIYQMWILIEI